MTGEHGEHGGGGGHGGGGVQLMPSGCYGQWLEYDGAHCCPHRALCCAVWSWLCSKEP